MLFLFLIPALLISVSKESIPSASATISRKIVVVRDVRPQRMLCYEGDSLVAEFLVSTGRRGRETSLGKYRILTKRPRVWSREAREWMLWWQSITKPQPLRNGIHALKNQEYEKFLGYPASHGCIRLSQADAKWLYDWTEIGDSVLIVKNWDRQVFSLAVLSI